MRAAAAQTLLTPEEYIIQERKAQFKSEYLSGRIIAMSGASRAHNLITRNISGELYVQLKGRTCESYTNDMRVRIPSPMSYTYPDVVVVCDEPRFEDDVFDTLLNPTVLFEVLSPSTEAYDRDRKFARYQQIASLREYVLVSQDRLRVEHYCRRGAQWVLTEFCARADELSLVSIGCELALWDIYALVQFPEN